MRSARWAWSQTLSLIVRFCVFRFDIEYQIQTRLGHLLHSKASLFATWPALSRLSQYAEPQEVSLTHVNFDWLRRNHTDHFTVLLCWNKPPSPPVVKKSLTFEFFGEARTGMITPGYVFSQWRNTWARWTWSLATASSSLRMVCCCPVMLPCWQGSV